jgi:hypothetical protein
VDRATGYFVRELGHGRHDPAPGRRPVGLTGERESLWAERHAVRNTTCCQLGRPPTRIRCAVEKLDGQALTVKSREGQTVTITLADNVAVAYLVKKNVGDIKPGDYIASTGIKGTDGKLHAIEVRISPSRCVAPARGNTRGISSPIQ